MSTASASAPAYPQGEPAAAPPETRGLDRDGVRLLAASPDRLSHARFRDLGRFLQPGDLLVVNTSATLPAAVDGVRGDGRPAVVHFSARLDDGRWVLELRLPDGTGPMRDGAAGERVALAGGLAVRILSAYRGIEGRSRLLVARPATDLSPQAVHRYLGRFGRPITYTYLERRWPLPVYQTIFASQPGSAEMPSAGRPFTDRLVTRLVARGVGFAPVLLHTGVSSPEAGEPPAPEPFAIPRSTAALVNATRRSGGRVIAVGTTVTRALESAAGRGGKVAAGGGWTELVLDGGSPAQVVDGLITGWHATSATHLSLLEAVAGVDLVHRAYDAAASRGYLWHEFGDSCLLLPDGRRVQVR